MGLTAPFIIAFHSTLKFKAIAGMAFWIMFAVSASGVVGRYLYAQIPRKVTTAELSMKELRELQERLSQQLAAQKLLPEADLRAFLRMPNANRVAKLPIVIALIYMMILDVVRMFGVAKLRRHAVTFGESLSTLRDFCRRGIANSRKPSTLRPKKRRCRNASSFCSAPKEYFIYGTWCISRSVMPLPYWR